MTEDTDITFEAISGKRFVIWGVTAEEESGGSITYSVTYDGNSNTGGTVPTDDTEYSSGDEVTVLGNTGNLEKTGYSFGYWNTKADGSGDDYDADATFTITANTTLYAQWIQDPYTVTLDDDSSTLTEASVGAGVELPTRSALNGYDFAGWSETNVATETTTAPTIIPAGAYAPTANITLYPVYTKTVGGGGTTHENASVTISDYATANSWVTGSNSGPQYKEVKLNSDITATTTGTGNNGKYYTDWRFYQNGDGNVIISATSGELSSVTFTFTNSNGGTLNYGSSAITSGTAVDVSGTSAEFTVGNSGSATNGQVRITAISVNYDVTGAGTTYYWSTPVAAAVEVPSIVVAENPFLFSTTATITCATEGAAIKYSFDGENWNDYTSALTITETKTIYAKAIKGENESAVAQISATKNLATPSVTISGDLTLDLDGQTDVNAGTLTAAVTYNDAAVEGATVTWSSSNDAVATIDASGVVTIKTRGNVTFTATYAGNSDYAEATATKSVTVIDNNAPGSAGNPYTVAQALAATSANGVYVKGIVSQIDEVSTSYGNATYYISDDGKTTTQIKVYRGKNLNNTDFTSEYELQLGDEVVITGNLTVYSGSNQLAQGNYLVSQQHPKHTVTWMVNGEEEGTCEIEAGLALTYETPADIFGKTFVGWVADEIDGEQDNAPTFVTTMPNEDLILYAVFANGDVTETSANYTLDYNSESNLSSKTLSYGNPVTYTATDGGVWIVKAYKNQGMQINSGKNSSIKIPECSGNITSIEITGSAAKAVGLSADDYSGSGTITYIVEGTDATEQTLDLTGKSVTTGYIVPKSGSISITKIVVNYKKVEGSFSGYCTTVIKPVAKIGNKGFATLQEAVDAAEAGQTIDIVDDFTLTTVTTSPNDKYNVNVNKSVTINGNGHVITSAQGKRALALTGEGNKITIKGLTIVNNKADWCMGILNNLTCTLDATTIDGTGYAGSYNQPLTIGSIDGEGRVTLNVTNGSVVKTNDEGTAHYSIIVAHPADITVTDSELIGWATVYLKPDAAGSTVKIEGSEMKSQGLSGNSNNFSILVTEGGNNTIEVKDTKITSSAVEGTYESLITLGGEGNVVKLLGETTYETNDKTWGAITHNWGSLMNNKLYLDDTTKAAFAEYLDGSHQETIEPADETGLYPVSFEPEVLYYWAVGDSYQGGYYSFADPFKNGWLDNGEFIALQKDITLTEDITCQLASGTSFNFLLGDFTADKNGHSVALNTGVTVLTDKQTNIFSAAEAGYMIEEAEVEGGFTYTAVKVEVAAPIVFHDGGTYEEALTVPMIAQAGAEIYYSTDGTTFTKYTQPIEISATTTVTAYAMLLGAKSAEVTKTFTIVAKQAGPTKADGYYNISTSGGKYVNVAGRKTVTLADNTEGMPGTVIRVKATEGKVETLRSQGVDVPSYAQKAMNYVPELMKEVINKLAATVDDPIIGEQGADLILDKFNKEFDYNLYLEEANGGYRIYGRTPSMKPVVDFYAENKDLVDSRLPKVEDFVKEVLQKIVDKMGRGQSVVDMFKIKTVWENMGGILTDPDVDQAKFFEEVLSSEENTWKFAYETGMLYWEKVKSYLNENASELGEYGKYLEKIPNVQPNFKYYIVPSETGVDIISQGNVAIENNETSAIWNLTPYEKFVAKMSIVSEKNIYTTTADETASYTEYYTTLYTDFAYTLPEGVKAYMIKGINTKYNTVLKEEIKSTIIPAQTPVLLFAQDEEIELTLDTNDGSTLSGIELYGNDWLINKYGLNTPQLETIFALITKLSSSLGEKYEHLKRLNAGTVNNKYFFNLAVPTEEGDFKEDFMNGKIKVLTNGENGLGFYSNYDKNLLGNESFMFSEDYNPIMLSLIGDVNRDGDVSIADVTALVNIILGKATYPEDVDKYDFDAANVNRDNIISIADVTKLVNIILGKE